MSYEQMEAMLVRKIAEVRASEAVVLLAFEERSNRKASAEYSLLQEQIAQVEGLLAAMDSASLQTAARQSVTAFRS
jgi:cell division protein FtsB